MSACVSRVRLLLLVVRCWVVFMVLGWSCSVFRSASTPQITAATTHRTLRTINNNHVGRTANTDGYALTHSASCPKEEPLLRLEPHKQCYSEKLCRKRGYIVHWRKRQCLKKCPPRYIAVEYYCSLRETCSTRRISNLKMLDLLRNCTVIEGSLEIVLIESVSEKDWKDISFPDLVEITDFLLLNTVQGLKSLGQLFPNLAVIRGMKLFDQYSLVIYNTHLEDIGLHSLTSILRGNVRIQNNINLCYVNTVNWNIITNTSSSSSSSSPDNSNGESLCRNCCPSCPIDEGSKDSCQYCWNSTMNQRMCDDCVSGCTADKECCHEECVGGCQASNNDRACHACRHFTTGDQCVKTCPSGYLQYKDYRCVTKGYCDVMNGLVQFNGTHCLKECPPGYQTSHNEHEKNVCKKCQNCDKPCHGILVNSVARAQELRGCKTINGSLIISIRYGKTVTKELEASLGSIERVTHYVRIFKTSTLKSLNFLRSLEVIEGGNLYSDMYALFVHENANLEDIWDFDKRRNFKITRGKIIFHANPKLCYKDKIERLVSVTAQEEDFSMRFTNGDKVACSIMKQNIHLVPLPYKGMLMVSWQPVYIEDDRKITGYYIYYKETNNTDVKGMDEQDACEDKWDRKHEEVNDSDRTIEVRVTGFKPSCRYAIYVETDTVTNADYGVRSNISYVDTLPYNPSPPKNVRVVNKGDAHLELSWAPPTYPNGKVVDYVVKWTLLVEKESSCVDHCSSTERHLESIERDEGRSVSREKHLPSQTTGGFPDPGGGDSSLPSECCSCPQETRQVEEDYFDFESRLNNYTYIHRTSRSKRSVNETHVSKRSYRKPLWNGLAPHYTDYQRDKASAQNGTLRSINTYINITGLSHYSKYIIKVSACHEINHINGRQLCSNWSHPIIGKTTRKDHANLVSNVTFDETTKSSVKIVWSAPESPNGEILAYDVSLFEDSNRDLKKPGCLSLCNWNSTDDFYSLDFYNLIPATKYLVSIEARTRDYFKHPFDLNENTTISFTTLVEDTNENGQLLVIIGILLILAIMCGIFVFRRVRPHKLPIEEDTEADCVSSVIPRKYIINPMYLKLGVNRGEGCFGIVFEGKLWHNNVWVTVAVKKPINFTSEEEMMAEAKLMFNLQSHHIVRAYGVIIRPTYTFLVMEYMSGGDLHKHLRQLRDTLTIEQVCDMALQIADGMAYLASKNYVHRDLAARNCLLNDEMKIKISDFGMTRAIEENYYNVLRHQLFPVRWTAPECFNRRRFSTQSDVWSFGIVVWEILTNGKKPYEEIKTNDEVRERVSNGYTLKGSVRRLTEPWLADLVSKCWEFEGNDRPSFPDIITELLPYASPDFIQEFRSKSYYHQSRGLQ